jgi:cell division transport system ATP-binding protein
MIKFDNVTKVYPGDFTALENVNLVIEQGDFVSIVGQSGAGKSTLLKLIYAEEQPTSGRIYFNDRPVDEIKRRLLPYFRKRGLRSGSSRRDQR